MTEQTANDEPLVNEVVSEDPRMESLAGFVDFLKVDTTKEMEDITTIIDGILAKFEEFCTVIELIRMESKDLLFTTLPVFHERCQQLKPIFEQTDILENFVATVRKSVEDSEEKVRLAERELGNSGLKKILNTVPVPKFLSRNKELKSPNEVKSPTYEVPKSFRTDDYFSPTEEKTFKYGTSDIPDEI